MVVQVALLALPLTGGWMLLTNSISLDGFGVGFLLSVALLVMLRAHRVQISWARLPDQFGAFVQYVLTLGRDVVLSSIDVARRVLDPDMPLNTGIIKVPTQDQNEVVAAFSAHGITMTPGELVVDFDQDQTMYVHCLDVTASSKTLDTTQTARKHLLNRILGKSE